MFCFIVFFCETSTCNSAEERSFAKGSGPSGSHGESWNRVRKSRRVEWKKRSLICTTTKIQKRRNKDRVQNEVSSLP